jgi:hypothetical protein
MAMSKRVSRAGGAGQIVLREFRPAAGHRFTLVAAER